MNSIDTVFARLKESDRKAFIPYVTAGDPDLSVTAGLLDGFVMNGADIIEVGVPFSDPMADGVVIQQAMERALNGGATLKGVLRVIRDFRRRSSTPVVLMGYLNPFWAYGFERFARDAGEAGVDGVLTVDLPPEEAGEFTGILRKEGIAPIFLVSPVSDAGRLKAIMKMARGFLYFVSVTGVTGERSALPEGTEGKITEVRSRADLPVVLGFGISDAATIRGFRCHADGFVVGSALIKRMAGTEQSPVKKAEFNTFVKGLAAACHGG
jgi:tryptophan synthase alpha chain